VGIWKSEKLARQAGETLFLVAMAGGLSYPLNLLGVDKECILMVYLLAVLFTSVVTGSVICGIFSAAAGVLMFNFFYTEPRFTLEIYSGSDIILLLFFLITAVVSGVVASRLQRERELAARNEKAAQELYRIKSEQEEIRLAMEREKLRSTLLRSVAHDLRTPLTALSGAGNLLADEYQTLTDAQRRKLAADMSEEITWLSNLVENILHMTRIQDDKLLLHSRDEVVDDVIGEAVARVRRLLGKHSLKVSLPDDVVTAPMDGQLVVQVLINLLQNAIRHTQEDAEIVLSAQVVGGNLEFTVADTGPGVDASLKECLFVRFVSLDRAPADARKGIGLGLSICQAIVDAHGGEIRVTDAKPHGAVFTFTIPLEVPQSEQI